jgi:hypothetical protein
VHFPIVRLSLLHGFIASSTIASMPVLHEPQLEKNSPPIHFLYEGHKSFDLNIICNIKILYFNPLETTLWRMVGMKLAYKDFTSYCSSERKLCPPHPQAKPY